MYLTLHVCIYIYICLCNVKGKKTIKNICKKKKSDLDFIGKVLVLFHLKGSKQIKIIIIIPKGVPNFLSQKDEWKRERSPKEKKGSIMSPSYYH